MLEMSLRGRCSGKELVAREEVKENKRIDHILANISQDVGRTLLLEVVISLVIC